MEKQQNFQKYLKHSQLKSAGKRMGTSVGTGSKRSQKVISFIIIPHYCLQFHSSFLQISESTKAKAVSIRKNTNVGTSGVTLTWFAER